MRDKQPASEDIQKQGKEKEITKAKDNQVKHIAQKSFSTSNRYAAIADEGDEDN